MGHAVRHTIEQCWHKPCTSDVKKDPERLIIYSWMSQLQVVGPPAPDFDMSHIQSIQVERLICEMAHAVGHCMPRIVLCIRNISEWLTSVVVYRGIAKTNLVCTT